MDVPAGVTQEEGHTGFFIHLLFAVRGLIFLARKIQPFLSLVDRELVGHFYLFFCFFIEKKSVYRDRTHVPTCQKVTRLPLSYRSTGYSQYKIEKCVIVSHSTGPLSRMYSTSTFYAQNPALEIVDQQEERECLSTHTSTKGMFIRTNPLCAASCVTKNISPRFSPTTFYRDANSILLRAHLCTAVLIRSMRRTLCSKLFIGRA